MPLHPNLTSGYGVLILYTQPHTFTFQIDFHTQDRSEEKNKIERKRACCIEARLLPKCGLVLGI